MCDVVYCDAPIFPQHGGGGREQPRVLLTPTPGGGMRALLENYRGQLRGLSRDARGHVCQVPHVHRPGQQHKGNQDGGGWEWGLQ